MPDIAEEWQDKLVKEIRRKAIHLSGLSVPFGLLVFGRTFTAAMIALALVVALVLERQRLRGKISLPEVRVQEKDKVASYIYYIAGSLLCVLLFPPMIAVTAMLLLSLGDTVSGLVGSVLANSRRAEQERDVVLQARAGCCRHVLCVPLHRLPRLRDNPSLLSASILREPLELRLPIAWPSSSTIRVWMTTSPYRICGPADVAAAAFAIF